jgi:16S rRNA (guanine966-N2)-methyltransferase
VKNKLRIIGGDWRSRQLSFVDAPGLRPTPARVRETLFNWLQYDIFGKQCLDLYAGSGALGFEAASRGAKSVIQVENNVQACRCLKDNALALSAADRITVVQSDVLRYLEGGAQAFDVVFLDPPFALTNPPGVDLHLPAGRRAGQPCVNLVVQTCLLLENNGWLAKHAKVYVETERHFDFSCTMQIGNPADLSGMPENWRQLKSKSAGEVGYHLFERVE